MQIDWVHKQKSKQGGPKERRSKDNFRRKNNNLPSLARDNLSKVGSFHPIEIGEKESSHNHVFKYKVVSTLNRVALFGKNHQ